MFDYVVFKPNNKRNKPRYFTAGFSIIVHFLVVGFAIGLPILYASDALPEPPDMMAFVVEAPPPPPPPPPPAPPPEAKKPDPEPAKNAEPLPVTKPVPVDTIAAPVEPPKEVVPETGAEGAMKTAVEAGFEKGVPGGIAGGVPGGLESAPPPPPPPPKPQGPVRVGGQIKAPQLTNRVNPAYPPAAQSAQVGGNVVLEATVDKTGHVTNVKVLQGQPLLEAAAVAAVKQWTYEPLMLNGEPTPFILTVTVTFSIPR